MGGGQTFIKKYQLRKVARNDRKVIALNSWGSGGAVSPPAGPGQSPGRGPGGGAPGSLRDFVIFEALKWLRMLKILLVRYNKKHHK